jgi:isoleucyl-tRNA synthetase
MVSVSSLKEIDRYALDTLNSVINRCVAAYARFEFHTVFHTLHNYCSGELSALYLDILKDRLYCEETDGELRRAAQSALFHILDSLIRLLAPILVFTAEEVWGQFNAGKEKSESVHYTSFPGLVEGVGMTDDQRELWKTMFSVRQKVSKALEESRAAKNIGSSLEASVIIEGPDEILDSISRTEEIEDFFIVSEVKLQQIDPSQDPGPQSPPSDRIMVRINRVSGKKCPRCWKYASQLEPVPEYDEACPRCAGVVG